MTLQDRYLDYLLRRMRHLVYRTYRDIAVSRGLLSFVTTDQPDVSFYRVGPAAELLLDGNIAHDTTVITRLLSRTYRSYTRVDENVDDDGDDSGSQIAAGPTLLRHQSSPDHDHENNDNPSDPDIIRRTRHILSILRTVPRYLRPDDVAVAVQLAIALDDNGIDVKHLTGCLRKSSWLLGITADVSGFCSAFARLLEGGAFIPKQYRLRDGNGGYSLSGRLHLESSVVSNRTAITMRLQEWRDLGLERSNRLLTKALKRQVPIIVAEDEEIAWSPRLTAAADLWLTLPRLDPSIVRVTVALCTDHSQEMITSEIKSQGLQCSLLTLDDLVLAIDPRRSAYDIVNRLVALTDVTETEVKKVKRTGGGKHTPAPASAGREPAQNQRDRPLKASAEGVERIAPVVPSHIGAPQLASDGRHVTLEALAGFGPAREWGLALKQDLEIWRSGKLAWSDMSTKLLLSGPPGTGKTTYARAMCNSLQIPLFVSSVSKWLEPGYLGQVLRRMSDAFSSAQASAPSILFLDEIDGIGKRANGSRPYDDYWTQVVNRALELLDGALKSEGVIIVGATNYPERIDSALLRSGRLETHIPIPMPDTQALADILRFHLGQDIHDVLESTQRHVTSPRQRRIRKANDNA